MGSQTFQYVFKDGTATDTINVTVSTPATNGTGYGLGYAVTAITGSIGGVAITGETGTGGTEQTGSNGAFFDNTIFAASSSGSTQYGASGSSHGLDVDGLQFTVGATTYNLFSYESTFYLDVVTANLTDHALTLQSSNAPCYCPGTLILTARGETPVQDLRIGDTVVTASGEHRTIRWLGRRSYAGRFLAANPNVQPIRFHAGSLGNGLPRRDLLVSPKHAMFLDGVLVPAECLVNDSTIVRDRVEWVDYFHVELDTHDVLLADGAPSESYIDDDNRGVFHNASEFTAMYPHAGRPNGLCAPNVEGGFEVEAIRQRLAGIAGEMARAA